MFIVCLFCIYDNEAYDLYWKLYRSSCWELQRKLCEIFIKMLRYAFQEEKHSWSYVKFNWTTAQQLKHLHKEYQLASVKKKKKEFIRICIYFSPLFLSLSVTLWSSVALGHLHHTKTSTNITLYVLTSSKVLFTNIKLLFCWRMQ